MGELFEILSRKSPKILGFTIAAFGIALYLIYSKLFGRRVSSDTPAAVNRPRRRVEVHLDDPSESVPEFGTPNELLEYDRLLDHYPDHPALLYNRGSLLLEAGEMEEACDAFLTALDRALPDPDLALGHSRANPLVSILAGNRNNKDVPDLALDIGAHLQRLRSKAEDDLPLLHGLATLARLQDRDEEASALYDRILEVSPEDEVARVYREFLSAGRSSG